MKKELLEVVDLVKKRMYNTQIHLDEIVKTNEANDQPLEFYLSYLFNDIFRDIHDELGIEILW